MKKYEIDRVDFCLFADAERALQEAEGRLAEKNSRIAILEEACRMNGLNAEKAKQMQSHLTEANGRLAEAEGRRAQLEAAYWRTVEQGKQLEAQLTEANRRADEAERRNHTGRLISALQHAIRAGHSCRTCKAILHAALAPPAAERGEVRAEGETEQTTSSQTISDALAALRGDNTK